MASKNRRKFTFTLNTSTNCFLCLDKYNGGVSSKNLPTNFSIQSIVRYLTIDLNEIVSTSDFLVSLCENCGEAVEKFSKFYEAMELSRLRVEATLEVIQKQLSKVEKGEDLNSEVVQELRQVLIDKCNSKVRSFQPRITLKKAVPPGELKTRSTHKPKGNTRQVDTAEVTSPESPRDELEEVPMEEAIVKLEDDEEAPQEEIFNDDAYNEDTSVDRRITEETSGPDCLNYEEKTVNPKKTEGKDLTCKICSKTFPNKGKLTNHSISHSEGTLKCSYCHKKFHYQSTLDAHVRKHTKEKPFKCHLCPMRCIRKFILQNHLTRVHNLIVEKRKPERQCSICGKILGSSTGLRYHMATHTEKSFACSHCPSKFALKSTLTTHLRIHTGERPFKCPQCSETFGRRSSLKEHINRHNDVKPHKCRKCDLTFYNVTERRAHELSHEENPENTQKTEPVKFRPFKCQFCLKRFTSGFALKKHLSILHNHIVEKVTPEFPVLFKCSICDKSVSSKASLKFHMRLHTGEKSFQCHVCPKVFTIRVNLMQHLKVHNADKPFKCHLCAKTFTESGNLKAHLNRHEGIKRIFCHKCGHGVYQNSELIAHHRRHPNCETETIRQGSTTLSLERSAPKRKRNRKKKESVI